MLDLSGLGLRHLEFKWIKVSIQSNHIEERRLVRVSVSMSYSIFGQDEALTVWNSTLHVLKKMCSQSYFTLVVLFIKLAPHCAISDYYIIKYARYLTLSHQRLPAPSARAKPRSRPRRIRDSNGHYCIIMLGNPVG